MTRLAALKQSVITLRVKQSFFIKACTLKAVVNIRGKNEIILVLYKLKKLFVSVFRDGHITVYVNISWPECPHFLLRLKRKEAARIHIVKAVFRLEIGKVFIKTLARVDISCSGGKTCACTYKDGVCAVNQLFNLFYFLRVCFHILFCPHP